MPTNDDHLTQKRALLSFRFPIIKRETKEKEDPFPREESISLCFLLSVCVCVFVLLLSADVRDGSETLACNER